MLDGNNGAASSAAVEVPSDPQAYAEWRQTGKLPEPKAESAPAKKSSEAGQAPAEGAPEREGAPESEPGKKQEPKARPSKAETRLNEILEDLRKAGLSPAELKTFKREAQQAAKEQPKQQPEKTEKPAGPERPVKPKPDDFETYEKYEEALDKYHEDLADYKAGKKLEEFQQKQRQDASAREMNEKLEAARERYGEAADGAIGSAADAIFNDAKIPAAVKALIDGSDVLADLLYTMGSKSEELAEFVQLAQTNPAAAIRKAVLMEELVKAELGKGKAGGAGESGGEQARGEDGKFVKKAPEKKVSEAPPPPKEVSGRGAAPPDEIERAVKDDDFRSYRNAANRRDLARRRG